MGESISCISMQRLQEPIPVSISNNLFCCNDYLNRVLRSVSESITVWHSLSYHLVGARRFSLTIGFSHAWQVAENAESQLASVKLSGVNSATFLFSSRASGTIPRALILPIVRGARNFPWSLFRSAETIVAQRHSSFQ